MVTETPSTMEVKESEVRRAHANEVEIAVDSTNREDLEGQAAIDMASRYAAMKLGFVNGYCSEVMSDIVSIDATTGKPIETFKPDMQISGYRRFIKLARMG